MTTLNVISSILIDPYRERPNLSKVSSCLISGVTGVLLVGTVHAAAAGYRHNHRANLEPNLTHKRIAKIFQKKTKTPKIQKPEPPNFTKCTSARKCSADARKHNETYIFEFYEQDSTEPEVEVLDYGPDEPCDFEIVNQTPPNSLRSILNKKEDEEHAKKMVKINLDPLIMEYEVFSEEDKRETPIAATEKSVNPAFFDENPDFNGVSGDEFLFVSKKLKSKKLKTARNIIVNRDILCTKIDDFDKLQEFCRKQNLSLEDLLADADAFNELLKSDRIRRMFCLYVDRKIIASPRSVKNCVYAGLKKQLIDYSVPVTIRKVEQQLKKNHNHPDIFTENTHERKKIRALVKQAFPGSIDEFLNHTLSKIWLETEEGIKIKSILLESPENFSSDHSVSEGSFSKEALELPVNPVSPLQTTKTLLIK